MASLPAGIAHLLADATLVLHFGIVVFVLLGTVAMVLGGLRGWDWVRHRGFRILHLVLVVVVAAQAWLGQLCPLTVLENALRNRAGQATYGESFIQHWLSRLMFFEAPWWTFVAAYTAFAALVVACWWWVPPRRRRRRALRRPTAHSLQGRK